MKQVINVMAQVFQNLATDGEFKFYCARIINLYYNDLIFVYMGP